MEFDSGIRLETLDMVFNSILIILKRGPYCVVFLSPASRSEEGGLLNSPPSVRPSVFPSIRSLCQRDVPFPVPCPRCCSLCEKHHYTIKAGDTGATRTLVSIYNPKGENDIKFCNLCIFLYF